MDILEQIKTDRAEKRKKQPFSPTLFDRISGLVKEYRLRESFLEKLESPADFLLEKEAEFARVRQKQPFMIPLFSLTEQREYVLTLAIIEKVSNPYLEFAQSPEEIALSKLLFDLNPALGAEKLQRYHFETLVLYEQAKTTVKELAKDIGRKVNPGSEDEFIEKERLPQDSPEKRMVRLQNFMAQVEASQVR
jgi:hypothetical protein